MYNLTILSLMRNGATYADRYFQQINAVAGHFQKVCAILTTGNNQDDTVERARGWVAKSPAEIHIYHHDTGAPTSYDTMQARWEALEHNWNLCLDFLPQVSDYVACIESDLIWQPDALLECIRNLHLTDCDVISPMLYADGENRFYDINGFRLPDGRHFNDFEPIIPNWDKDRWVKVQSAGGMVVARGDTFKRACWKNECRLHFDYDTQWVVDTSLRIDHQ
jgi:hypothetical protein